MKEKILIIDDEEMLIQMTKSILKKRGFRITACLTAEESLPLIEKEKPDLIILDYLLPGKNGIELCREIKSHPATSGIPILMTTGQNLPAEPRPEEQEQSLGPDDFLTKPFEIENLLEKIERLLK